MENVVSKKCCICNKKQPSYGLKGTKIRTHCYGCFNNLSKVDQDNMEDIAHRKCCLCNVKQPSYGNIHTKIPTHCAICIKTLSNEEQKKIRYRTKNIE
jgi:hypothetical protein